MKAKENCHSPWEEWLAGNSGDVPPDLNVILANSIKCEEDLPVKEEETQGLVLAQKDFATRIREILSEFTGTASEILQEILELFPHIREKREAEAKEKRGKLLQKIREIKEKDERKKECDQILDYIKTVREKYKRENTEG